jgi:hypothetical protein
MLNSLFLLSLPLTAEFIRKKRYCGFEPSAVRKKSFNGISRREARVAAETACRAESAGGEICCTVFPASADLLFLRAYAARGLFFQYLPLCGHHVMNYYGSRSS